MVVLPPRRVEARTLEDVEARPVGVVRDVEETDCRDEHVALGLGAGRQGEAVHVTVVVPDRALDAGPEPQVRTKPEVRDRLLEVAVDLRLASMRARPVVALEREGVDVRVDVDLGARVLVVPPRATDALGLLVDGECRDAGIAQQHSGGDAAHPRADDHDLRRAVAAEQLSVGGTSVHQSRDSRRSSVHATRPFGTMPEIMDRYNYWRAKGAAGADMADDTQGDCEPTLVDE